MPTLLRGRYLELTDITADLYFPNFSRAVVLKPHWPSESLKWKWQADLFVLFKWPFLSLFEGQTDIFKFA